MLDRSTLTFDDASGDVRYYVVLDSGVHYMELQERGSRQRLWMFRRAEDLEKFALLTISQGARPGDYRLSPRSQWRRMGVHANVTLAEPDPERLPGRVSITIAGESVDRGWMGKSDAVAFSHAIVLTFDELDHLVREGIPEDGFRVATVGVAGRPVVRTAVNGPQPGEGSAIDVSTDLAEWAVLAGYQVTQGSQKASTADAGTDGRPVIWTNHGEIRFYSGRTPVDGSK